jgi:aldehyde dehydrogenase (NAD+)
MQARRDEIIGRLIREARITRIKATLEWEAVHAGMMEAACLPYQIKERILTADVPGKESRVYRKPAGVVGAISPWNWPLQLTNRSLAPALAVGNAVVVKPAGDTPVTGGLLLANIFKEAVLPPGLLRVVVGSGREIGDDFVKHPVRWVISFTGSTPIGRGVARLANESAVTKRVELELGGDSPFVLLGDGNLDRAIEAAVFGKFLYQEQICMIANWFIVDERPFAHGFAERVSTLQVGDPDKPDTIAGPIINERQLQTRTNHLGQARGSGVRQVAGGEAEGLVLPPHIFADVTNDMPVAHQELFGPIAPVIRVASKEQALAVANNIGYGLSSCIFTKDIKRGVRFAQRMDAGTAHVNELPFTIQHTPLAFPSDPSVIKGSWMGG